MIPSGRWQQRALRCRDSGFEHERYLSIESGFQPWAR